MTGINAQSLRHRQGLRLHTQCPQHSLPAYSTLLPTLPEMLASSTIFKCSQAGTGAQLVECSHTIQEALGFSPNTPYTWCDACNPSTREAETGRPQKSEAIYSTTLWVCLRCATRDPVTRKKNYPRICIGNKDLLYFQGSNPF